MTRKEEITKEAKKFAKEIDDWEIAEDVQDAFEVGAKWADEHPINYDGKAMLYVNQKSHDNGYKEAIDKAVEWLDKNVADIWSSPCNPDKIVKQFRKAMKGGEE